MKQANRARLLCCKKIVIKAGIVLTVLIALALSALRLTVYYIDDLKQPIIHYLEKGSGGRIQLDDINGKWLKLGPVISIDGLEISNEDVRFDAENITFELDIWRSLLYFRPQFNDLTFNRLNLTVSENRSQTEFSGTQVKRGSLTDIFLNRLNYFDLKESRVSFFAPSGERVVLDINKLRWLNSRRHHQAEGEVAISSLQAYHGKLNVSIDLRDKPGKILDNGQIYIQAANIDMKPWLGQWVRESTGIDNADFSLSSWIEINEGEAESIFLNLAHGQVDWRTKAQSHQIQFDNQRVKLAKRAGGWRLDAPRLRLISDGKAWPESSRLSLFWQPEAKGQEEILRIRASQMQLDYLKPILPIFTFLSPEKISPWLSLNPSGEFSIFALDLPLAAPEQFDVLAKWKEISWDQWQGLPSIEHLNGLMIGNLRNGHFDLSVTDSLSYYEGMFKAPLEIKNAQSRVFWKKQDERWTLWTDGVDIQAKSLWINGDMSFSYAKDDGPWLSILAGINLTDAGDAWRYYPEELMGEELIYYLTNAIEGGRARDATLIFEGNPTHFPYRDHDGKFQVFVPLKDATLQFQPTWQPLTELSINLDFINNGLWMISDNAKLGKLDSHRIEASIPAYQDNELLLDAEIKGQGQDIYDYLKNSPLSDSVAAALEQVQITGDVAGRLSLQIPFTNEEIVEAQGRISLSDNDIYITPVNITLDHVKGSFDFTNETLSSTPLTARWLGQPIKLNFNSENSDKVYRINVGLAGNWVLGKLPFLNAAVGQQLNERVDWNSQIKIRLPHEGESEYQIRLTGQTNNTGEVLASLLETSSKAPTMIDLNASGTPTILNVSGHLQKTALNSQIKLSDDTIELERAIWKSNSEALPELPKTPALEMTMGELNGDSLLPLLLAFVGEQGEKGKAFILPDTVELSTPLLQLFGQRWLDVKLSRFPIDGKTLLALGAKDIDATAYVAPNSPLVININYLYYNPKWPESPAEAMAKKDVPSLFKASAPLVTTFNHWPSIYLRCHDCWLMGQSIGELNADLIPNQQQLRLENGLIDVDHTKLTIQGEWLTGYQGISSHFAGRLEGRRFDESMRHFGVFTPLKEAKFGLDFDLGWQGEPWQPALSTLNGTLAGEFGRGRFDEMGGGSAGQLLRLVSVTAVLKRLQYDFSDSFGNDFDFDDIHATGKIEKGVIKTKDFLIDGTSADIAMQGEISLVKRRLDMEVVVAPEISAAAGVTAAVAINPIAGVAIYAATKVLTPLWNKLSFIRYKISGNFDNPEVDEILRQVNKEETNG